MQEAGTGTRGFTLIELMIVVALVGVLALIAYPSYHRHLDSARRVDGKVALMETAQRLERCHTRFFSYTHASCTVEFPVASSERFYEVTAATLAPAQFTLHATPQGVQQRDNDACGVLTLTHRGERGSKGAVGTDAGHCW